MNRFFRIFLLFFIICILLLLIYSRLILLPERPPGIYPLKEGWQYAWGSASINIPPGGTWGPYRMNQFPGKGNPSCLWLKIKLKQREISRPALLIPQYALWEAFEIWMAGRPVYASGTMKDAFINHHLYVKWSLIPLPSGCLNKDLYFRFYSVNPEHIGFFLPPYFGEYDRLFVHHISHDLDSAVIGVLFILGGMAAFLFLALYYRMKNPAVLSFAVLALSAGLYILSETAVTQLFWTGPVSLSYSHYISMYMMMTGAFAFLEQIIHTKRRFSVVRLSWQLNLLYMFISLVSEYFGLSNANRFFGMAMTAYVFVLAIYVIELSIAFNKGNREFRIVCFGLLIQLLAGIIDILAGLKVLPPMRVLFPYSLSILMGTMVYTLFLRYREERNQMEAALKEAEKIRRSEEEAIADERRRIAGEIHDGIAQEMALVKLKTAIWHQVLDREPQRMHIELNWLDGLLKKNIRDIRRCIMALRPVDLEELGFDEAVRRFAREFGQHNDIWVDFSDSEAPEALPPHLEPVIYRIIQETLNNTAHHAEAATVRVRLEEMPERVLSLTVTDDGKGFDTDSLSAILKEGHLGLKQMKERVENLGGSFIIRSAKGGGTEVRVTIPLSNKNGEKHHGRKRDKNTHCG